MFATLVLKLLRDVRLMLAGVAFLLAAFQCLWARVTQQIVGQLLPLASALTSYGGVSVREVEKELFRGPLRSVQTIIGGEGIDLENALDVLSIGYVHPLLLTLLCVWGVGRATGAIAGEIDRGTMELLLSQPLARWRLVLAHLCVDALTIPVLCLSMWAGNGLGAWMIDPIRPEAPALPTPRRPGYVVEFGPLKVRLESPLENVRPAPLAPDSPRLRVSAAPFGPALWLVGGLVFAVSGATMGLSAAGRSRWRVLGVAVFALLAQLLVNLVGQMWEPLATLRPLTVFYYYQPQQVILRHDWCVTLREWNGGRPLAAVPMPAVLFGVGALGYALAAWTFQRRDLPAPL
jgi:ABC-2 type transport system permease protein